MSSSSNSFNSQTLRAAVGTAGFYAIVAEMDPANASGWQRMVEIQENFRMGEEAYDEVTRTYSESMRHTLHWAMVFIFEDPKLLEESQQADGWLLDYFIKLHSAAFKANGACSLGDTAMQQADNAWQVLQNASWRMKYNPMVHWDIAIGMLWEHDYSVARRAADHVRRLRQRAGLPVARDGYIKTPPENPVSMSALGPMP